MHVSFESFQYHYYIYLLLGGNIFAPADTKKIFLGEDVNIIDINIFFIIILNLWLTFDLFDQKYGRVSEFFFLSYGTSRQVNPPVRFLLFF